MGRGASRRTARVGDDEALGRRKPARPGPGKRTRTGDGAAPASADGQATDGQATDGQATDGQAAAWEVTPELMDAFGIGGDDDAESEDAGAALPGGTRATLEATAGTDLGGVRVHTDDASAQAAGAVGADAFTVGQDIHFAAGKYAPESAAGQHLIAHEVAHTVQQGSGAAPTAPQHRGAMTAPGDPHEQEADAFADAHARGEAAGALSAAAPGTIARRTPTTPAPTIDAREFVNRHGVHINAEIFDQLLNIRLTYDYPGVFFSNYPAATVGMALFELGRKGRDLWTDLVHILGEAQLLALVNEARGADRAGQATDEWRPRVPIAQRVATLLAPLANAAMARLVPQYVPIMYRELVADTEFWPSEYKQRVPASALTPAHPMDRLIVGWLCEPGDAKLVIVDRADFEKKHPETERDRPPLALRDVTLAFEPGRSMWVRATPPDASAAEVARALYGDPAFANLLTPAPPLWGFQDVAHAPLRPPYLDQFKAQGGGTRGGAVAEALGADSHWDDNADAEILQGQARMLGATGANRAEIIQRMRLAYAALGDVSMYTRFGGGTAIWVRARLDERSRKLERTEDAGAALAWDAQSAGQLEVIGNAVAGLSTLDQSYKKLAVIDGELRALPPFVRKVLGAIESAYLAAIEQSDLVVTARERLTAAQLLHQQLPVDLQQGMLTHLDDALFAFYMKDKDGKLEDRFGLSDMDLRAREIRVRLGQARVLMQSEPEKALGILAGVEADIATLQLETTVVSNVDSLQEHMKLLSKLKSKVGFITGKNVRYDFAVIGLYAWVQRWEEIYDLHKSGDTAGAQGMLQRTQQDPDWQQMFRNIADVIEDEEEFEQLVTIGIMIGIAIATMGASTLATGVVAGMEMGALASFATIAIVDTATATLLTNVLIKSDVTLDGLVTDLATGLVMYGASRALAAGFGRFIGNPSAQSTKLVADFLADGATALIQADLEKRKLTGQGLSDGEAVNVLIESFVTSSVASVVARVGESPLRKLHDDGVDLGKELKAIRGMQDETLQLAAVAGDQKTTAAARAMLEHDQATLQREKDLLDKLASDPDAMARLQLDPTRLTTMQEQNALHLADRDAAVTVAALEPAGAPDTYLIDPADVDRLRGTNHVYDLGADEVTQKKRYRVEPKDGSRSFIVTERMTGVPESGATGIPVSGREPSALTRPEAAPDYHAALTDLYELESLDPASPAYRAARAKLVEKFGARAVARYEATMVHIPDARKQAAVETQLGKVVETEGLDGLRSAFAESQIIVDQRLLQSSSPSSVKEVKVTIVAPEGTPHEVRAAMEARANGMTLATAPAFVDKGGANGLPVRARVMSPQEYAGNRLTDGGRDRGVRIDETFSEDALATAKLRDTMTELGVAKGDASRFAMDAMKAGDVDGASRLVENGGYQRLRDAGYSTSEVGDLLASGRAFTAADLHEQGMSRRDVRDTLRLVDTHAPSGNVSDELAVLRIVEAAGGPHEAKRLLRLAPDPQGLASVMTRVNDVTEVRRLLHFTRDVDGLKLLLDRADTKTLVKMLHDVPDPAQLVPLVDDLVGHGVAPGQLAHVVRGVTQLHAAGRPVDADAIRRLARLAADGRVVGIEDFAKDLARREPSQAVDVASEAVEAGRLAAADPTATITVGQDSQTPGRSFDMTISHGGGPPKRSVEVETEQGVISRGRDMMGGIAHAASKFPADVRGGTAPRPAGEFAGTLRIVQWPPPPTRLGGDAQTVIDVDGNSFLRRPGRRDQPRGNVFDAITGELNGSTYENPIGYLNDYTIIDGDGNVLARFVNDDPNNWRGTWRRVP